MMPAYDVVLRAIWNSVEPFETDVPCDIFYELDGGVNAVGNPVSYVVYDLPVSIAQPTKLSYIFLGWTVVFADGNQMAVVNPVVSYIIPVGTTGDVTLYAHWAEADVEEILYTVIYRPGAHVVLLLRRLLLLLALGTQHHRLLR